MNLNLKKDSAVDVTVTEIVKNIIHALIKLRQIDEMQFKVFF